MLLPDASRGQSVLGGGSDRPATLADLADGAPGAPAGQATTDAVTYHLAEALRLLGERP